MGLMSNIGNKASIAGWRAAVGAGKGIFAAQTALRGANGIALGAGGGALYGAMSDNTSILGGAMMGAGIGGGMRYGAAGMRAAGRVSGAGLGFGAHARALGSRFGLGASVAAKRDFRSAMVMADRAGAKIGSHFGSAMNRFRGLHGGK